MTSTPSFKNCPALTSILSRRRATSHRIVASEPVTERLGPRSIPISMALFIVSETCALCNTLPVIRPAGRLFITLQSSATPMPIAQAVLVTDCSAPVLRSAVSQRVTPVLLRAPTKMNNPATRGSTDQDTFLMISTGLLRAVTNTTMAVSVPVIAVGKPSGESSAEATSSATAVMPMPTRAT